MKRLLAMAAATAAVMVAAPALAQAPSTACTNGDISFGAVIATDCEGFFTKNQIQGDVDAFDIDKLDNLLPPLTGLAIGDDFITKLEFDPGLGDGPNNVTFTGFTFFGLTYFGLHTGKGNTGDHPGANASAYYVIDFGAAGGNTLTVNADNLSNIAVFATGDAPVDPCDGPMPPSTCGGGGTGGVPEPATWAMMIMGFGAAGTVLRRRRTVTA